MYSTSCCIVGPIVVCTPDPRLYCSCRVGEILSEKSSKRAIKSSESYEPKYKTFHSVDSVSRLIDKLNVNENSILFHKAGEL